MGRSQAQVATRAEKRRIARAKAKSAAQSPAEVQCAAATSMDVAEDRHKTVVTELDSNCANSTIGTLSLCEALQPPVNSTSASPGGEDEEASCSEDSDATVFQSDLDRAMRQCKKQCAESTRDVLLAWGESMVKQVKLMETRMSALEVKSEQSGRLVKDLLERDAKSKSRIRELESQLADMSEWMLAQSVERDHCRWVEERKSCFSAVQPLFECGDETRVGCSGNLCGLVGKPAYNGCVSLIKEVRADGKLVAFVHKLGRSIVVDSKCDSHSCRCYGCGGEIAGTSCFGCSYPDKLGPDESAQNRCRANDQLNSSQGNGGVFGARATPAGDQSNPTDGKDGVACGCGEEVSSDVPAFCGIETASGIPELKCMPESIAVGNEPGGCRALTANPEFNIAMEAKADAGDNSSTATADDDDDVGEHLVQYVLSG